MSSFTLAERVPLVSRNTLRVDATAAWLATVEREDALDELLRSEQFAGLPVLVLGAGSNVLFAADFPGLVICLAFDSIDVIAADATRLRLKVGAGVNWDRLVDWTLSQGAEGLENLALIPGLVGAAPIQNIGAYGVEIREFIDSVTVWDRTERRWLQLANADCGFDYRHSRFKAQADRYVVTSIELELPRHHDLRLEYPGIRAELESLGIARPCALDVATAVRTLRRRKLPDPRDIGNAGSFFKNPVVSQQVYESLRESHPSLPSYPVPTAGHVKLSAAWLIEACGLKGYRQGDAGISAQHALVLVNHGRASGAQLLALARHVIATVAERFEILLEPEPRIVGAQFTPPGT